MLRTERHKLVYYPHDVDELYDEQDDPWELRNLAGSPSTGPYGRASRRAWSGGWRRPATRSATG